MMGLKNPIFVALDLDSGREALEMAKSLAPYVGGFKLGPRLILREGPSLIASLAALAPVFVDQKYYDIPNTMEHAIRATSAAGATFATIHAGCGPEALRRLAQVEQDLNAKRPFKILAVTVLTSFSQESLPPHWSPAPIFEHVVTLAQSAIDGGLSGIVCSALEVNRLREHFPQAFLVTPGIRLPRDERGDQARTLGPNEAVRAGASAVVVGRPIIAAPDPVAAAKEFQELVVGACYR